MLFAENSEAERASGRSKEIMAYELRIDPKRNPELFSLLSRVLDEPLPQPWSEEVDQGGNVFYWNSALRQSTWRHPTVSTHAVLAPSYRKILASSFEPEVVREELDALEGEVDLAAADWRQSTAPDGTPYYYRAGTNITRWDDPRPELAAHVELRRRMLRAFIDDENTEYETDMGKRAVPGGSDSVVAVAPPVLNMFPDLKHKRAERDGHGDVVVAEAGVDELPPSKRCSTMPQAPQDISDAVVASDQIIPRRERQVALERRGNDTIGVHVAPKSSSSQRLEPSGAQSPGSQDTQQSSIHAQSLEAGIATVDMPWIPGWEENSTVLPAATLVPDEIGLLMGMDFQSSVDVTLFGIMKPLFQARAPMPWQTRDHVHGRKDFYHPLVQEVRNKHPMWSCWVQMYNFLKEQAHTGDPMQDLLSGQVFQEASMQYVRLRLGMWEGPILEDGQVKYKLLVRGSDPIVQCEERADDPKLEATTNILARLHAWLHLWRGFVPNDVPFPFADNHLHALAVQLAEVTVMPVDAASNKLLATEKKEWPEPHVMTAEETKVQPLVTACLGDAYGTALHVLGRAEHWAIKPDDPPSKVANFLIRNIFRAPAMYIEEEPHEEPKDECVEESEREESFEEESEEEEAPAEESTVNSDVPCATDELSAPSDDDSVYEARELLRIVQADDTPGCADGVAEDSDDNDEFQGSSCEQVQFEMSPVDVMAGFQPECAARLWAQHNLRPHTPEAQDEIVFPPLKQRPAKEPVPRNLDQAVWSHEEQARNLVAKPWVCDLGFRCSRQMLDNMLYDIGKPDPEEGTTRTPSSMGPTWTIEAKPAAAAATALQGDAPSLDDEAAPAPDGFSTGLELDRFRPVHPGDAPALPDLYLQEKAAPENVSPRSAVLMLSPAALKKVRRNRRAAETSYSDSLSQSLRLFEHRLDSTGHRQPRTPPLTENLPIGHSKVAPLQGPFMPVRRRDLLAAANDITAHVIAVKGNVARANTPTEEVVPPPYMANAEPVVVRPARPKTGRPSSAGLVEERCCSNGVEVPVPRLRPLSATGRCGITCKDFLAKPLDVRIEMGMQHVRRLLKRVYGTLEKAFAHMDKGGKGFITRSEWEHGLLEEGYSERYDLQDVFTSIDKHNHCFMTLPDLVDRPGALVHDRIPGLMGLATDICLEAVDYLVLSVLTEVLTDTVQDEFTNRRTLCSQEALMEDVQVWLTKQEAKERKRKEAEEEQHAAEVLAAATRALAEAAVDGDGSGQSRPDPVAAAPVEPKRKKKAKKEKRDKKVKKGWKGGTGSSRASSEHVRASSYDSRRSRISSRGRRDGLLPQRSRTHSQLQDDTEDATPGVPEPASPGGRVYPEQPPNLGQPTRPNGARKLSGPKHTKEDQHREVTTARKQAALPWVPRPTNDIFKIYRHIGSMVQDPEIKSHQIRLKKPVHVSMPQLLAVDGASGRVPRGGMSSSRGLSSSTSTPSLVQKRSMASSLGGLSTMASSTWHPSDPSDADDGRSIIRLPPVASGTDKELLHAPLTRSLDTAL